jgi:hypothetical protein
MEQERHDKESKELQKKQKVTAAAVERANTTSNTHDNPQPETATRGRRQRVLQTDTLSGRSSPGTNVLSVSAKGGSPVSMDHNHGSLSQAKNDAGMNVPPGVKCPTCGRAAPPRVPTTTPQNLGLRETTSTFTSPALSCNFTRAAQPSASTSLGVTALVNQGFSVPPSNVSLSGSRTITGLMAPSKLIPGKQRRAHYSVLEYLLRATSLGTGGLGYGR